MSDLALRAACIHGRYEEHSIQVTDNSEPSSYTYPCLGGREVTIDYEGARMTAEDVLHHDVSTPEIDLIILTAIGDTGDVAAGHLC